MWKYIIAILLLLVAAAHAEPDRIHQMVEAVHCYDRAVERHDYVATTRAQQEALELWQQLSDQDREVVENQLPGTWYWLEGGSDYAGASTSRPTEPGETRGRGLRRRR